MSAYFIFNHKVTDSKTLNDDYLPKSIKTLKPYHPEILVVDQNVEVIEGNTPYDRMVILKFENKEVAKEWYNSKGYQDIIDLRLNAVNGGAILCNEFKPI